MKVGRNDRRAWAEVLVVPGGALLVVSFFLPLIPLWIHSPGLFSSADFVGDAIGDLIRSGSSFRHRLKAALGVVYLSTPHLLGAVLVVDTATSRIFPGHLERAARIALRCILLSWLAGCLSLPLLDSNVVANSFRIFSIVATGLLVMGWIVPGRWSPPRNHFEFMRRGGLIGALLAGAWFIWLATMYDEIHILTTVISAGGLVLIAAGSILGLFVRPDSA
ncbi:MAG: hypothetical protein ABFS86_15720 [Planctomycetota bacterium]